MNNYFNIFTIGVILLSISVTNYRQTSSIVKMEERFSLLEERLNTLENKNKKLDKAIKTRNINVIVTAYTPSKKECDNDPTITASMKKVRLGTIAVSRDLFKDGWIFGLKVYIYGIGIFEINDLMNKKHKNRIDIFMWKKERAKKFGVKKLKAALLDM